MNPQQAENLRILIRHMETKCDRTLYMGVFFLGDENGCGTPACALGEATCVPALRQQDLVDYSSCYDEFHASVSYGQSGGRVFGLTVHNTMRLFGQGYKNVWGSNDVTPREWAAEARKVLAENGYDMEPAGDPKADAFVESIKRMERETAASFGSVNWPA